MGLLVIDFVVTVKKRLWIYTQKNARYSSHIAQNFKNKHIICNHNVGWKLSDYYLFILFLQHLYSALFTNKYALMRYKYYNGSKSVITFYSD